MSGFKAEASQIVVNIQDQIRADFRLETGAVSETVVVTGTAPQLQTQDASVGTVATQAQINDLPLNGRNYTFLAQLSAGVTSQDPTRGLDLSGSFVANGLSSVHNNYIIDGVDNNNDTVDFKRQCVRQSAPARCDSGIQGPDQQLDRVTISAILESHDDENAAYKQARELL